MARTAADNKTKLITGQFDRDAHVLYIKRFAFHVVFFAGQWAGSKPGAFPGANTCFSRHRRRIDC